MKLDDTIYKEAIKIVENKNRVAIEIKSKNEENQETEKENFQNLIIHEIGNIIKEKMLSLPSKVRVVTELIRCKDMKELNRIYKEDIGLSISFTLMRLASIFGSKYRIVNVKTDIGVEEELNNDLLGCCYILIKYYGFEKDDFGGFLERY